VLRFGQQASRGNLQEMPLSVGFGQPPALNQTKIELPVSMQQVLFASGQGRHTIKLRKMTMSPNVA